MNLDHKITALGLEISIPEDWYDATSSYPGPALTFTKTTDGAGALQVSSAVYVDGQSPAPSLDSLRSMVEDFGKSKSLGEAYDSAAIDNRGLLIAAASFNSADDFIRVWFLSNGTDFVLITYVANQRWSVRKSR